MTTHSIVGAQGSLTKALRITTVIVGGYTFTAVACHWLKWLVPSTGQEAQLLVNMAFFLIYLVVLMALFCGTNHRRAIAITLLGNALFWTPWFLFMAEGAG